ncbi:IQ domain-containing protein IQM1 [Dichanthelium oligosanthes]|uniref:IQ domain-containing protein IQM1 n=1 Tax=Dichanthelium oligosanthes TaxID=888268 RepID=A0A1E5UW36_9POAL|nr:IQ domain-containing protein IQM1 [Dichanthelium oligosanthes]
MTLRLLNTERNHLLSPKPHSPRDGGAFSPLRPSPRVSCKTSSTGSPRSKSSGAKMACGGLERSLSFKNWEEPEAATAAGRGGGGINGARPGTLALQPQQQQSPRRAAATSPAQAMIEYISPRPRVELDQAATKLQKIYKGHRTRRSLADGAIIAEELWWKAYDSVYLNIKSISFFDGDKQETAASRWSRAGKRIAKVGKGLSKDEKAQKLALQHWLEAIDPRHRYGHNLHLYYDIWSASSSCEPFFYWLDIGAGRDQHHPKCPRSKLYSQLIMYLGPNERAAYEVIVEEGRLLYKQSGELVNTNEESKWIFVLSTSRSLYVGQKRKGKFQHSSFLSGAATTAAGRLVAKEGVLKAIWPYSGHYLPTEENFREFIGFLEENSVDLANVKRCSVDDDEYPSFKKAPEQPAEGAEAPAAEAAAHDETVENQQVELPAVDIVKEVVVADTTTVGGDEDDVAEPKMMASRPSFKWSTPTGARIGCLRDYPADLQSMALEQVNLSPRVAPSPSATRLLPMPIPSPRPSPRIRLSPRLHYMGLPTPTGVRLPIPSPGPPGGSSRRSPKQQFVGFQTPAVALTLPKHKGNK